MSCWIILLFLLCRNGDGFCCNNNCMSNCDCVGNDRRKRSENRMREENRMRDDNRMRDRDMDCKDDRRNDRDCDKHERSGMTPPSFRSDFAYNYNDDCDCDK